MSVKGPGSNQPRRNVNTNQRSNVQKKNPTSNSSNVSNTSNTSNTSRTTGGNRNQQTNTNYKKVSPSTVNSQSSQGGGQISNQVKNQRAKPGSNKVRVNPNRGRRTQQSGPNQNTSPKVQNTPPQVQNTPPQVQNTPPQVQNTPPKVQNTPPQVQNTPPQVSNTQQSGQNVSTLSPWGKGPSFLDVVKQNLDPSQSSVSKPILPPMTRTEPRKIRFNGDHVLQGEISTANNKVSLVGGHHLPSLGNNIQVRNQIGQARPNGVYQANVDFTSQTIHGPKTYTKKSTMFPDNWSQDKIKQTVTGAMQNAQRPQNSKGMDNGYRVGSTQVDGHTYKIGGYLKEGQSGGFAKDNYSTVFPLLR